VCVLIKKVWNDTVAVMAVLLFLFILTAIRGLNVYVHLCVILVCFCLFFGSNFT